MARLHLVFGLASVFAGVAVAAPAHAQSTEGAIQLGLATPIISHTNATVTTESNLGDRDTDTSRTEWGIGRAVIGELGYGLNESLVLGAVLQLNGASQTSEYPDGDVDSSAFGMFLGPKLDYVFAPGSRVRPFVGAIAGLALTSSSSENDIGRTETSLTGFELQGRAGLRCFITDSFSVDPAFFLAWDTASGETENSSNLGLSTSNDVSASGVTFGITLGLSGWVF